MNDYRFGWDRITSFEGDTGPYLQYAHVRLCSIMRRNHDLLPLPPPWEMDLTSVSAHPKAHEIGMLLGSYPDVVRAALRTHDPSGVVTYAMRLSHAISSAWETVAVKSETDRGAIESAQARLCLFLSARNVLAAAMRLLTLKPLERM